MVPAALSARGSLATHDADDAGGEPVSAGLMPIPDNPQAVLEAASGVYTRQAELGKEAELAAA